MPDRLDSIAALMFACRALTCREVRIILRRRQNTTTTAMGRITATTSASRHWIRNITISAPIIVTPEMNTSSGP